MDEVNKYTTTIRLRGKLQILASFNEQDILNLLRHTIEKVSSPYGCFRLDNSSVFFLHNFSRVPISNKGWAATEAFKDEYEEECNVTNLEALDESMDPNELAEQFTIDDLWQLIKEEEEEDDGFGVPNGMKAKATKSKVVKKETMNFKLYMKMSGEACTTRTQNCAPVIHYEKSKTFS